MERSLSTRRRTDRVAMLASCALIAIAASTGTAAAQTETEIGQRLTFRSDIVTISEIDLRFERQPGLLGIAPDIVAIGIDGNFGNDRITTSGTNNVEADLDEFRPYVLLPEPLDLLVAFLAPLETSATAYGVEGGFGTEILVNRGTLTVGAKAAADQTDFDIFGGGLPLGLVPISLESTVSATSEALRGGIGAARIENRGAIESVADARAGRLNLSIDPALLDSPSSTMIADATARGLAGDRLNDVLWSGIGMSIVTRASSTATSTGIALEAVKLTGSETASQAFAGSEAMAGGGGSDQLTNDGILTSEASGSTTETGISLIGAQLTLPESGAGGAESLALAAATGMAGGDGADVVLNNGSVELSADADFRSISIELSGGGISGEAIATIVAPVEEETLASGAIAEIAGIRGDERGALVGGADRLTNRGLISGEATAFGSATAIDIGLPVGDLLGDSNAAAKLLDVFGIGLVDYSADAAAFADGVRGDAGNDEIANMGVIDIAATATSRAVGVGVSALDLPPDSDEAGASVSINSTVFNAASNAVARATGLSGGEGDDSLRNIAETPGGGDVSASATADAASATVSASLAIEGKAIQFDAPVILSRTNADARATGIDGGEGFDTIENTGAVDAIATSVATNNDVGVTVQVVQTGGGINASIVDNDITATSFATGIRDGLGSDMVRNDGSIAATADAEANSASVSVGLTVSAQAGLAASGAFIRADQVADATAVGLDRMIDDRDADASFANTGDIDATADARSTRTTVAVDGTFSTSGAALAAPIISNSNEATSFAAALRSLEADDNFDSDADLSATALSDARSTGVSVGIATGNAGVGIGVAGIAADTTGDAKAHLLSFGDGADSIVNRGNLLADATGKSISTSVSVALTGAASGVGAGGSLVDSRTVALADAVALDTGSGDDSLHNQLDIDAVALADTISNEVSVAAGAAATGVGLGVALARADSDAEAMATAVRFGDGADMLDNEETISADATATAFVDSVNVGIGGSATGVSAAGALADTSLNGLAEATGVDGGGGGDLLINGGTIDATALSDVDAVGVSAAIAIGAAGLSVGVAGLASEIQSSSDAIALDGGAGQDHIESLGDLAATSTATASSTDVAVAITIEAKGVALGGAIIDNDLTATSLAVGAAGDTEGLRDTTGDDDEAENDYLGSSGAVTVASDASADAVSVSVSGQFAVVPGGAAVITSKTLADSLGIGLYGGSGADWLENVGTLTTTSTARSGGPAVTVTPIGGNVGNFSNEAFATAIGIGGGAGDDRLENWTTLQSNSDATASGKLIQVTLIGGTVGDLSTRAEADALGLAGDAGNDFLFSDGGISATATAAAPATAVAVNLTGASLPTAAATADATATAIDGGGGDDEISAAGTLAATSTATIQATSVAVTQVGAGISDLTTSSRALAAAVRGGEGENIAVIDADLTVGSTASARSTSVGVAVFGAGFADARTQANADSFGYQGAGGGDAAAINGSSTIESTAIARNESAVGNFEGAGFSDSSPEATAFAAVLTGAAGDDTLIHGGVGTVASDADVVAGATTVSLLGAASGAIDTVATAGARGIDGGADADVLANTGTLTIGAVADVAAGRRRITLAGASIGSMAVEALSGAIGLDGGAGADAIENLGALTVAAESGAGSTGIDIALLGAAVDTAEGGLRSTADATAISGGDDDDNLSNSGAVSATATANGNATQGTGSLAGAGLVDATILLSARSAGLDGGEGDDNLLNSANLAATAIASGTGANYTVTLFGAADGDVSSNTTAASHGLLGGGGDDRIEHRAGTITTRSTATGRTFGLSVSVAGALLGGADSISTATTFGIDAGSGDDLVTNGSLLDLRSTASGSVGRVAVGVAGGDVASVTTDIVAGGTGIAGGSGRDVVDNQGEVRLTTRSTTSASSTSVVLAGVAAARSGLFSTAGGIGIDGGSEVDVIVNGELGSLLVDSAALISSSGLTVNLGGLAASNGLLGSRTAVTGMAGGEGHDSLFNLGAIDLLSTATAQAGSSNFNLTGVASAGGDVSARATATGLDGGDGNDIVESSGSLAVAATSRGTFGSSNLSLAGYSGAGAALGSSANAFGLVGGAGLDTLRHAGDGSVRANAILVLDTNVDIGFGVASSERSPAGANALAIGLDGGDGNDRIYAVGSMHVAANAAIDFSNTRFAIAGSASGSNSATGRTSVHGARGGGGDDEFVIDGPLTISTEATSIGSGSAGATFGATTSASEAVTRANAIGLEGGDGVDSFVNFDTFTVELTTTSRSVNSVTSGAIFSDGIARSRSRSIVSGVLIHDVDGDTSINNIGTAMLTVHGDRGSFRGVSRTQATSNGVTVGVSANANADSRAVTGLTVRGIQLGAGEHGIANSGTLWIRSFARGSATSTANGNTAISGFGTAFSRVDNSGGTLIGIDSLLGATSIFNDGTILVENRPTGGVAAAASATGLDFIDPDARSTAQMALDDTRAFGIRLGDAADGITNSGTIDVTSAPSANRSLARSTSAGAVSLSVDSFASASATADNARAYGIDAGGGHNIILNEGLIVVSARPYAEARAEATGSGPDGDVTASASANARNAIAYGIVTGSGNDRIENSGTITVAAVPSISATVAATEGCFVFCGERSVSDSGSTSGAAAFGILSGAGDDVIFQSGTINATGRVAIDAGDGNDVVLLLGGTARGDIRLGSGDDALRFNGGALTEFADGGGGRDLLHLVGGGTLPQGQAGFEDLRKEGAGTFFIGQWIGTGDMTILAGTVSTNAASELRGSSNLTTTIYANGSNGRLALGAFSFLLGGDLTVEAAPGAYVDGRRYDVVTGEFFFGTATLFGAFGSVSLPDPTALLSFSGAQISSGYRVTAHVESMAAAVESLGATEMSFASALDGATPIAEGEVAGTIAALQALPTLDQVEGALTALTPRLPTASLSASSVSLDQAVAAVEQRTASFRAKLNGRAAAPALAFDFADSQVIPGRASSWSASFNGGVATPSAANGVRGPSFGFASGFDLQPDDRSAVGFSMAALESSGAMPGGGAGNSKTTTVSLYGVAGLGTRGYANAVLSWGKTRFDGARALVGTGGVSTAGQRASLLAVDLESGTRLSDTALAPEFYGALSYRSVAGGGYREAGTLGAPGLGLVVEEGRSERLESAVGMRMSDRVALGTLGVTPRLGVAWLHRFGASPESVTANFAAMPDYRFRLDGDRVARDALRAELGLDILTEGGLRLSVFGVGEAGGDRVDVAAQLSVGLDF